MMLKNPYAGEHLEYSEYGLHETHQHEATFRAIFHCLTHRTVRTKGIHNYHPVTDVCVDCGITALANAAISYGKGVPCLLQKPFTEEVGDGEGHWW